MTDTLDDIKIEGRNTFIVYCPESIEYVLLNCIPKEDFLCLFNQDVLERSYLYCDVDSFSKLVENYEDNLPASLETWEQLYTNYLIYLTHKNKNGTYSKHENVSYFYLKYANNKMKEFIFENL